MVKVDQNIFFALDVETANADYSSICQIGIAKFKKDKLVDKWVALINPETHFDWMNTEIHGIDKHDVKDCKKFNQLYNEIVSMIENNIVVHHMSFDKVALNRVCDKYNLPALNVEWVDSAKIARRTWEQFAYKGYGLGNISKFLNIEFKHHDALEDAIASGRIAIHACKKSGMSISEWVNRIKKPIKLNTEKIGKIIGNKNGGLFGENIVFTGSLFLPRNDISKIAANMGCNVGTSVTKETTILVVGIQDGQCLAGYNKSSKHRRAEALIKKGQEIKIISENDFIGIAKAEGQNISH